MQNVDSAAERLLAGFDTIQKQPFMFSSLVQVYDSLKTEETNEMKEPLRIGILYPLHSAEDDYPKLAAAIAPPVKVHLVHTESPNLHQIEASRVTGSREYLFAGVEALREYDVDVCMWACTSGSFAFGIAAPNVRLKTLPTRLACERQAPHLPSSVPPMPLGSSALPLLQPTRKTWQMRFVRFWLKEALRLCTWVA